MKLRAVVVERMPGIDQRFELEDLDDGLNIILGPNGVGKSRLCAAVKALVWSEINEHSGFEAAALFDHEAASWRVVRDGSLHRWQRNGIDAEPPILPGIHLDGCFFLGLRDLLDDSDRAGRDLAKEIRRQMSGGFDLDVIERRIRDSLPARVGSNEKKALDRAEQEIQKAELAQAQVAESEQDLARLKEEAAASEQAQRRWAHFETAISLQRSRADQVQLQAELAELPDALANLDGSEVERIDKLEGQLAEKRRQRDGAGAAVQSSREAARATRLAAPLGVDVISTWNNRARELDELERRLQVENEKSREANEAALELRRALGGIAEPDREVETTLDDDLDRFEFLRQSQQLELERASLTARLGLLAAREFSHEDSRRRDQLKRAAASMRSWLRAHDPASRDAGAKVWPPAAYFLAAGALCGVIGLGMQLIGPFAAFGAGVTGLAIGLAAAGFSLRVREHTGENDGSSRRSLAEEEYPDAVEPPESWSSDAVTERLNDLEVDLAKLETEDALARERAVERSPLVASLKEVEERAVELQERRLALANRLGLDDSRPDADMVALVRALDAAHAASAISRGAAASRDECESKCRLLLSGISDFLLEMGEAAPTAAASALGAMESLVGRDRSLREATNQAQTETARCQDLDGDLAGLAAEKEKLFRVAGLEVDDRRGLIALVEALDGYRGRIAQRDELASNIRRCESALEDAGEGALASRDLDGLEIERARLKESATGLPQLNQRIGQIHAGLESARKGHVLEDAIAQKSAALRGLCDRRDQALGASAGRFLVDCVRREHETNQMPRVLARAHDHFQRFTHHRYELKVSPTDEGSFVAVEKRVGGLSLDELSDGTRAQLILAARLAFAEEVEQAADLPLFLDEALDHSDPERFHAIARSLADMVSDGRQVFYLSNDPTDVERFRTAFEAEGCDQLATIDLGEIRGRAMSVDGPEALRVAPLAPVPSAEGETAEGYGAAIGIALLHPGRDAFSQHLYYLLRDDLALLHDFLEAQIATVGQCRNLLAGGSQLAKDFVGRNEIGAQLGARIALFENFCLGWRQGRGKPVGRVEIEQSAAVSERYLDPVVEIAAELAGDAVRLIATLRDRKDARIRGFRSNSATDLERHLVEGGHIDDKPVLAESEIIERLISTPAGNLLSPKVAAELSHLWWSLSERGHSAST